MSKRLSFSDLKAAYGSRNKHPSALTDPNATLPKGNSTLDILQKLHFTRERGLLPEKSKDSESPNKKVIAICLVIVDKLHHEDIWKAWIEDANEDSSNVYKGQLFIHAKYPEKIDSLWVKERTLQFSFRPDWNSIEVVQAMLALLEEATSYKEKENGTSSQFAVCERCIFGTETCIPIRSVKEMGQILFETNDKMQLDKSWLHVYNTPKSNWESANCFRAIDSDVIPRAAIFKSLPGWIMLTRRHGEELLALIDRFGDWKQNAVYIGGNEEDRESSSSSGVSHPIIRAFGTGGTFDLAERCAFAPEEMFFPTMLALLGYLRSDETSDEVYRGSAVFAEWKRIGDANPISYSQLSPALMSKFRDSGALLARKFSAGAVSVVTWTELIGLTNDSKDREGGKAKIEGSFGNTAKRFRTS